MSQKRPYLKYILQSDPSRAIFFLLGEGLDTIDRTVPTEQAGVVEPDNSKVGALPAAGSDHANDQRPRCPVVLFNRSKKP